MLTPDYNTYPNHHTTYHIILQSHLQQQWTNKLTHPHTPPLPTNARIETMRWYLAAAVATAPATIAFSPSQWNYGRRTATALDMSENNFLSFLVRNKEPQSVVPIETEEQRVKRLRNERLAEIESGEIRRQERVAEDKFAYLFLFALQLLPLVGNDRTIIITYFFGVAVTTVYLGGRQEVIDKPERVEKDKALYAPIAASIAIGGLYLLLKVGIDISSVYAAGVTVFGALAISGEHV
jgi:hypothetical protein